MIRPLRTRHRMMMVLLAVGLPAILAAGLMARRPVPTMQTLSRAGAAADGAELQGGGPRVVTNLADGTLIALQLFEGPAGNVAALSVEGSPGRPEWLVYWTLEPEAGGRLPEGAALLGVFEENRLNFFDLPDGAAGELGRLIVYRPVSGEVLGSLLLSRAAGQGSS